MEWYKEGYYVDGMEEYYKSKLTITKMKGKILEIESTGRSWSGPDGLMWVFSARVQALNDTIFSGEANAKSETVEGLPYKIGDDVEFEHTESNNEYPDKLKIKKEGSYSGGEKSESKNRGFALRFATDLAIKRMDSSNQQTALQTDTESILKEADKLVAWLDSLL